MWHSAVGTIQSLSVETTFYPTLSPGPGASATESEKHSVLMRLGVAGFWMSCEDQEPREGFSLEAQKRHCRLWDTRMTCPWQQHAGHTEGGSRWKLAAWPPGAFGEKRQAPTTEQGGDGEEGPHICNTVEAEPRAKGGGKTLRSWRWAARTVGQGQGEKSAMGQTTSWFKTLNCRYLRGM